MKYLTILLIFLIGCQNFEMPVPKFAKSQGVKYRVSPFYRLVCSGNGTIQDLSMGYHANERNEWQYIIETPFEEKGCPSKMLIFEKDISVK